MEEAKADYLAVKQAIGKPNINILFIRKFKIEGKSDKNDSKLMAITTHRIYVIVTQKQNAKVEFSFHILELNSLDCSKSITLNLAVNSGEKQHQYGFLFASQEDVNKTAAYLLALMKSNFPDANVLKHVMIKIEDEKKKIIEHQSNLIAQTLCGEDQPACGSFASAYRSLCDLYNQAPLEEVIWDITKIYASHNCKDFKLEDFDHLEPKELLPLFATLSYNTWFTSLVITSYKLSNELIDIIIKIIRLSSSIEEFVIKDAHIINKDQIQRISLALSANPNKCLRVLDLSRNSFEDKGVVHLSGAIGSLDHELEGLYLSEISLSAKGASILANSFKSNKHISSNLTVLNLSGNSFKADGAQAFCDFLAQPNVLRELNIANTECALDLVFGALLRGCQQNLTSLNVSGNPFSYKKSKEIQSLPSFQQFFSSSGAINYVNISNTRIPPVALKALLVGLINNPVLTNVGLNLSRNELKSAGAHEVCSCVKEIKCLTQLDLSDNGLESDLIQLCEAVQSSTSIRELNIGQNISKTKHLNVIGEALAEMVMSEILPLETLSIADCKLRLDATALFDCLGTNESLTALDISGNQIGDVGARLLAKALQINTKLKEIMLDRNNITHKGLQDIFRAMARNVSLLTIPLPIVDLTASLKHNSDAFSKCFTEIEKRLIRNQSMKESTPEQVYKIHQNLCLSTVDHYTTSTDNLVVELQDLVMKYQNHESEIVKKTLKHAKTLIREADLFRQVLTEFFSDPISLMKSAVEKFNKIADDIADSSENLIQANLDNMIDIAKRICSFAFDKEELLDQAKSGNPFDKGPIYSTLMQLGKGDVMYKLCEANLTVANYLADFLKEQLVQSLQEAIERLKKAVEGKLEEIENVEASPEITLATGDENEASNDEPPELPSEKPDEPPSEDEDKKPETAVDTTESEARPVLIPAIDHVNDNPKGETFEMTLEFDATKGLVESDVESQHEEDTSLVAAQKARTRLQTVTSRPDKHKQKRSSVKRRPTFYRQSESSESPELKVVEIPVDESPKPEPISKRSRSDSFEVIDAVPREHLPSVGDFDAVSSSSAPLKVAKDRAKPMARRRAPTRVSKLAHMNTETSDAYIEEQAKAPPRPMSPRPISMVPPIPKSSEEGESHKRRNTETAKTKPELRPETPKRVDKKEPKKDKKGKSPIGGIKLPALLKRNRSSSKGTVEVQPQNKSEQDVADAPPPKPPAPTHPINASKEQKPEPVQEEPETLKPLPEEDEEKTEKQDEVFKDEQNENDSKQETEPVAAAPPRPEPVKRQAPKIPLVPGPGGSALLAEMKMRQNKDKQEEPKEHKVPPATAARPQRPKPPEKPEPRSGSVSGGKPPPPKRPPSVKRPPLTATASTEGTKASPPPKPKRPTPAKRAAPKTPEIEKDVSKDLKITEDNKTTDADRTNEETPPAKDQPEETQPLATPESAKEQPERESNEQEEEDSKNEENDQESSEEKPPPKVNDEDEDAAL